MMSFKKVSLLFSFVAIFYGSILTAQIKGIVADENNSPLEYATVAIYKQADKALIAGIVTDSLGGFSFTNIAKGSYFLKVSFIGYNEKTINSISISNSKSSVDLGAISLSLGTSLNEVIIKSERATVVNKIDRQVFDAEKFKNAQGGSGIDVVRNLPSVTVDGQGEISVRGSSGFVLLLNGKPIQGNAASLLAQLPANSIERVEVITAPSAKYDPEGKAGILNIITKKGALDGSFAQLNIKGGFPSMERYDNANAHQRYGIDATYNFQNKAWNYSFGLNYQRNDIGGRREGEVFTIINNKQTRFPSTGERSTNEINYSGRFTVDFTPNENTEFSLGFFAGKRDKDRLADIVYFDNHAVNPPNSNNRLYTFQYFNHNLLNRKSDFALGSLDYKHTFENKATISTSLLYEYTLLGGPTINQNLGFPDETILYQDEFNTNNNPLHGTRFQVDYSFAPFENGLLETGYQFRSLDHTGDFVYERRTHFNDDFQLVPEFSSEVTLKRIIHSVYGQYTGKSAKWDYAFGTRLEIMDRTLDLKDKANTVDERFEYDFAKLFPSASVQYALNDKTNIKAAYSKRVERTTTFKMNPFPEREHSETLEQGDPNLLPEFIDLVEVGFNKKLKGGNSVNATAYYRHIKNLVNRVNTIYNDTILNRIYSNVGNANVVGLELSTQLKPTDNWSNFIGFNMYNYAISGEFDNNPVNSETTVYGINMNSTYSFWKNASLQFTFNYLSERVTAQGEDSRFYSPNLTFQKSFFDGSLVTTLQWQNIDMGLLNSNEQRITTYRPNEFYTTTNYIYEVDVVMLNFTYTFKKGKNKSKFIDSEFGKQEF
jgi:outer membrane receptor protein involved in Fe transport